MISRNFPKAELSLLAFIALSAAGLTLSQSPALPSLSAHHWEAEALPVVARQGAIATYVQATETFGSQWSQGAHLWVASAQLGDWLEVSLPPLPAGEYEVAAALTRAADYCVVQFSFNGRRLGQKMDLWAQEVERTERFVLGKVTLTGGADRLRLEIAGRNVANRSPHYQFGVDTLELRRQ